MRERRHSTNSTPTVPRVRTNYGILVDENTSPRVATALRAADHEAVHVTDVLECGATDEQIVQFAGDRDLVILTHDDDFLQPEYRDAVPVLYYSDDGLDSSELVGRVEPLAGYVPEREDLPPVTNLGS